jgi:RNA polymerase sigma factor (sigma-70 family)
MTDGAEPREKGRTPPMAPSDNEIMESVRDGRVEKLAVLFERHHIALFNFFLRLSGDRAASEDLVQDVFMRILKYRAGYHGDSKFAVWMFQIARNAHVDWLRKRKGELPLDDQLVEPASAEPRPERRLETERDAELIRQALERLSPRKREVLMLFRFEELKLREIAEVLGCQVGTVKAQVHRALKDLGRVYGELQGGPIS